MGIELAPRSVDSPVVDIFSSTIVVILHFAIGVISVSVIWAIFTDPEAHDAIGVFGCQRPRNTSSIGPFEVLTISARVTDGNEMPVIYHVRTNILGALISETDLPIAWHSDSRFGIVSNDISVPFTTRAFNFFELAFLTVSNSSSCVTISIIWTVITDIENSRLASLINLRNGQCPRDTG